MQERNTIFVAVMAIIALFAVACGGGTSSAPGSGPPGSGADPVSDPRGIGEVKEVTLNDPLKAHMVDDGKAVYELKCSACHKLTDQRVVGPGWQGITERRQPEWIMNMILNVDVMLEQDPVARKQLEECLVRMPNQNLSINDARDVLEFMYMNDGHPVGE